MFRRLVFLSLFPLTHIRSGNRCRCSLFDRLLPISQSTLKLEGEKSSRENEQESAYLSLFEAELGVKRDADPPVRWKEIGPTRYRIPASGLRCGLCFCTLFCMLCKTRITYIKRQEDDRSKGKTEHEMFPPRIHIIWNLFLFFSLRNMIS